MITVGYILGVSREINIVCTLGGALNICTVRSLGIVFTLRGALVLPLVVGLAAGLPLRAACMSISGTSGIILSFVVSLLVSIVLANILAGWRSASS